MSAERPGVGDMTQELPLFPLPRYTLFPNTLVPFHVYEPRYRRMLDDCLSGRRLLVVASLAPGWELSEGGEVAPVLPIAGLGRVLSDRRYPDGRIDIFVHGLARVQVTTTSPYDCWSVVDVEQLPDRLEVAPLDAHQRLVAVTAQLARALGDEGDRVRELLGASGDAAVLSNRVAALLVEDFDARQALLETRCPAARCDRLAGLLAAQLLEVDVEADAAMGLAH